MTVGTTAVLLLGIALGLFGPRLGRPLLAGLASLLLTLLLAWRAEASEWTFLTAALCFVVLQTLLVWLVVRHPRVGLIPALLVAMVAGVVPVMLTTGSHPSAAAYALFVLGLALGVWGCLRPMLGVRFASAAMGARLALTALPGETAGWQWPALAVLLFLAGRLASSRAELPRAPRRLSWVAARAVAPIAFGCVLAVALLTPELRPPSATEASRLERLRARAPRGGYLWPALSETVAWEDNAGYRAWDNLDVRYLNGTSDRGLFRVPGSSRLLGRFSLNREVGRMRAIKDASELANLQAAAHAIVSAVRETAPGRVPGVTERAIAHSVHRRSLADGCSEDSFPPVVASGARAASPHASPTDAPLREGELVVVDVGCSVNHYASDFTRTFPVGGHFTPESRRYYEAVYAAQQAALAACRPGAVLSGKAPGGAPS
jgi:hypothetical protein